MAFAWSKLQSAAEDEEKSWKNGIFQDEKAHSFPSDFFKRGFEKKRSTNKKSHVSEKHLLMESLTKIHLNDAFFGGVCAIWDPFFGFWNRFVRILNVNMLKSITIFQPRILPDESPQAAGRPHVASYSRSLQRAAGRAEKMTTKLEDGNLGLALMLPLNGRK